jgi:hypothetical protein
VTGSARPGAAPGRRGAPGARAAIRRAPPAPSSSAGGASAGASGSPSTAIGGDGLPGHLRLLGLLLTRNGRSRSSRPRLHVHDAVGPGRARARADSLGPGAAGAAHKRIGYYGARARRQVEGLAVVAVAAHGVPALPRDAKANTHHDQGEGSLGKPQRVHGIGGDPKWTRGHSTQSEERARQDSNLRPLAPELARALIGRRPMVPVITGHFP